ncbi:hypothetical protein GALMADRAFT_210752 [Galerina marginata CBS 339.88]|uniref:Uncharacterized protein n=1 Tax=Galerina marginata (strain CBS 339.88) TaxID=685588 RepID=A0A067T815_GALM3|nr:hypothetical protein GALMADRAFT_210752 [Galerina marginata CBS 339.88]
MAEAKKSKNPRSKAKAPKALPPTSPKPPVMLQSVAVSTVQPTAISPKLSDSANLPLPQAPTDKDQDADMYMPSVSPRQQQINLFWDKHTETQDASSHTDSDVESVSKP